MTHRLENAERHEARVGQVAPAARGAGCQQIVRECPAHGAKELKAGVGGMRHILGLNTTLLPISNHGAVEAPSRTWHADGLRGLTHDSCASLSKQLAGY
jgi:hypothetical protein